MSHLFHPAFVHFPIALLIVGGVWVAWGQFSGRQAALRGGGTLTIVGTLALVPTVVTGYLAANSVPLADAASRTFKLHELNGWSVLALFTGLLFWKAWNRGVVPETHRRVYGALLLFGVALVAYGALLGGELVFAHGTGVARP
jgi:uncharacterized membrane protein